MNLLEVLATYQDELRTGGREAADRFLDSVGVEIPHWHIADCFDDEGRSLSGHIEYADGHRTYVFE